MSNNRFQGKVAVVTGSASGVGRSLITAFAREGAKCVLADVDQNAAHSLADNLRGMGGEVLVSITDVSKASQVDAMLGQFPLIMAQITGQLASLPVGHL